MAVQRSTHPSADTLKAFGLGKLDDSSSGIVMDHLDQCQECRQKVTALSGDDFLQRLRQARNRSSTPSPAKSLAEIVHAEKSCADRTPIPNLPPELANNPHYEILRELGRGGMGVVYLAHNKLMDRLEVLKVVNKALLDHPGAVERFLREIRAAAKLSHANVVAAYSAVQQGELLAFAMEYVEGQDLASLVKTQGPLPIANACFYVQQAALGLQHAYEKQMVHRDIKPQNLILAREGKKHTVKVLDFGLAKVIREKTDDTGLTGEGRMLGTPDYIAPEQTLDAAKADIRADIYSLGCTLYFLLSGRPPFSANSLGAILLAHQMQEAQPLNLVRPEVPKELAAVVQKMMAKSPAQRYQTPREVVQALSPFIKPGAAPKSAPELSVGPVEPKPAVKKTARVEPPPAPVVEEAEVEPESADVEKATPKSDNPPTAARRSGRFSDVTIGAFLGGSTPNVASQQKKTVRKRPAATLTWTRKKWLIGGGIGVGVLLLALLGLWAAGVFKVKTKEGTLVLHDLPPNAEVTVDGDRVTFDPGDGKPVEIRVAAGKNRQVQVKKEGFKVFGETVEIDVGGRSPIRVHLEPLPVPPAEAPLDVDRRAAEWALALKGTIRVRVKGTEKDILAVGNLPAEPFQVLAIDLRSKPVGDEGLAQLKGLTHLTRLVLWGAGISDAGLSHLQDLTSLKELHLFANPKVTDAGLVHLKNLTNLRSLDLNSTGVTDAGMEHLKVFTNLTWLNLMGTRLSGAGFVHLKGLTNLTVFYLANSWVDDRGLAHLEGLRNLKELSLDNTRISDAGLVYLQGLKRLGTLHVTRGKVTNAGVAALRKALPDCRIHVHGNPAAAPAEKPAAQKADYDTLATGHWVRILTAPGESVVSKNAAFKDNVLELKESGIAIDRAAQAKDMIVRAKVKKGEGQFVGLAARHDTSNPLDGNRYAAWLIDNGRFGVSKWENKKWTELLKQAVPEEVKIKDSEFFEFALAVVGDRLTVYINGKRVLETRDPAALPGPGAAGVGTARCVGQFKDIEVQILDPAVKPDPAADAGFVSLFNGKDLTGWSVDGGPPGQWSVEGNTIVGQTKDLGSHYLLTDREYADFVLRFDFKVEDGSNGSVAIRAIEGEKLPLGNSLVLRHPQIKLTSPAMEEKQPTGMTHWLKSAATDVRPVETFSLPAGVWRSMEVVVRGGSCTASIGGKKLVDMTLDPDARNSGAIVPGLGRRKGKVGFQIVIGTLRFRKIEIKELPPLNPDGQGFVPLFNGKDLTGWKTHPRQPGHWRVVTGTNGNVLTGSGPAVSHLYSKRNDYQNFHLRVEARINDGGNSGVYFHSRFGPKLPANNPKFLLGYEAQINSTHSDPNKTGSLYAGGEGALVSIPEAPVPHDKWFTMEVIAQGYRIIVKVNGKTTADFTDEKRRLATGHIALQQHNPQTVAEFRKIEIKELPAR